MRPRSRRRADAPWRSVRAPEPRQASAYRPPRCEPGRYRRRSRSWGPRRRLPPLVAVVVGLVGAAHRHPDIGRLLLAELGEFHTERIQVQPGDLLVKVLRQHINALLIF